MLKLRQYLLNFSETLSYFRENLEGTNALSSAVLKYVNFEEGKFSTILYEDITHQQLYGFKWGGVGVGIKKEVERIVFSKLKKSTDFSCIFDDVDATYTPSYSWSLFSKFGVHYENEVYYVLSDQEASQDIMQQCFQASNAIWHSLSVLSKFSICRRETRSITESEIIDFAKMAELIVVGAYDEEGYIFWEK